MKKILILTAFILTFTALPLCAREHLQFATVVRVSDGDTVQLQLEDKTTPFRLVGIDCFETSRIHRAYKQAYLYNLTIEEVLDRGFRAKNQLEKILEQNQYQVFFKCTGVDMYGRMLGTIYTKDRKNINQMMLSPQYCPKYVYKKPSR